MSDPVVSARELRLRERIDALADDRDELQRLLDEATAENERLRERLNARGPRLIQPSPAARHRVGSTPAALLPGGMAYVSPKRPGRVYRRKFDWDLARRLVDDGVSVSIVARRLGVSVQAVRRVCDPVFSAAMSERLDEFQASGVCADCGRSCSRVTRRDDGLVLCHACASRRKALVTDTHAKCATCKEWRPLSEFSRSKSNRKTCGGIHSQCRSCQTKARRDYRERHKQPCIHCGEPALPPSEKGPRRGDVPRCRPCFHAEQWGRLDERLAELARDRVAA